MANATKTKNKKPNWFRRVGAKFKETFSELKRVSWPTFTTVLKTTGVVLVIVGAFLAVVTGVDALLGWLLGFVAVYLTSYLLTFTVFGKEPTAINLIVEFLPVVGMTATTASFRLTDAGAIRRFGLISSPTWLIYNIANFSIGAICCEVLSLGSILIGIFRHDRKKEA